MISHDPTADSPATGGGSAGPDSNLLLALLAFQNGFIDRDVLVDAVHAWVADKGRPLGQALRGWGALDARQLAALIPIVEEHLRVHGGDASRSVDAIRIRGDLGRSGGDLTAIMAEAGTPDAAAADGKRPDRPGCRYRKPDPVPHARGGLGEVFIADDLELGRKVALKEIRARDAFDDQCRARFLLEGEVTGNLEHPGIVPVYGLGTYDDGRPYYAMRFIRGETLREAVDAFRRGREAGRDPSEQALGLRKLLRRFVDACNAVEYAHSRGVLHRDLKPDNIMLGKFGETLVVDWGLAKPMGRTSEPAAAPSRLDPGEGPLHPQSSTGLEPTGRGAHGTPQYMSPEQAEGRLEALGPATDVHGLGCTLYYLLTGRPPFPDGIAAEVGDGGFPRPVAVDPDVPRALAAICRKAMATRPEGRYPSAIALADDVDRWLGDLPVSAYRDPAPDRLARWSRGHRPLIAGAATLLVAAVVGLAISNVAIRAEQARTEAERARVDQARRRAVATLQVAGRAVDRLMIGLAADRLVQIPGTRGVRENLADESLRVTQDLADRWQGDPLAALVAAPAYHLAANLDRNVGRLGRALINHRRAIDGYSKLLAAGLPDDLALRSASVRAALDYVESLRMAGRPDEALRQLDDLRLRIEAMPGRFPDDPYFDQPLARCLAAAASLLEARGRLPEARERFERAIGLLDRTLVRFPGDRSTRIVRCSTRIGLGALAREQGRLDDAGASIELALADLDTLEPSNDVDSLRASAFAEKARLFAATPSRRAEADSWRDRGIEILGRLSGSFPEYSGYRLRLAEALLARGTAADAGESLRILDALPPDVGATSRASGLRDRADGLLHGDGPRAPTGP